MNSKLIEALRDRRPITPQREGDSEYQRNKQLVDIARLASRGSTLHGQILCRMSEDNKRRAWTYSKAEVKDLLRVIYDASEVSSHGK